MDQTDSILNILQPIDKSVNNMGVRVKASLIQCVRWVVGLKAVRTIFNLISEEYPLTKLRFIEIVLLNLAVYNVRMDAPLRKLLKKYSWDKRYTDTIDIPGFSNALGLMYLQLKKISTLSKDSATLQALSYCPTLLLKHFRNQVAAGIKPELCVSKTDLFGTCMLADISGFTKMSIAFSKQGPKGLGSLHKATNDFIGKIIEMVHSCGGDVIAFAGDAVICVFEDDHRNNGNNNNGKNDDGKNDDEKNHDSKEHSGGRAVCCARELTEEVPKMFASSPARLSAHVALSWGSMSFATLGGPISSHWAFLLNGNCVTELHSCINDAAIGEIVITDALFQQISSKVAVSRLESGNFKVDGILHESFTMSAPLERRFDPYLDAFTEAQLFAYVSCFVPPPALDAIRHDAIAMIDEINSVTTLFLQLDSYNPIKHRDPLTLQPFFEVVQRALVETKGFLRQFLVDDKGCVVIIMWGISSSSFDNNASRAIMCAYLIASKCSDIRHTVSIGISTGAVYSGNIGSTFRRDFVGIGSDVNKAARLMSRAENKIFLDVSTFDSMPSKSQHQFIPMVISGLKGMDGDVQIYVYASPMLPHTGNSVEITTDFGVFDGLRSHLLSDVHNFIQIRRQYLVKQRTSLFKRVVALLGTRTSYTVVEISEASCRSNAVEYILNCLKDSSHTEITDCYYVRLESSERSLPYGLLKKLIREFLTRKRVISETDQKLLLSSAMRRSMYSCADCNTLQVALQRLNELMGWSELGKRGLHDQYTSLQSSIESRGDECWCCMLSALLQDTCTVVVLEDSHHCDEASMRILTQLRSYRIALKVYLFTVPGIRITRERRLRRLSSYSLELFGKGLLPHRMGVENVLTDPRYKVIEVPLLSESDVRRIIAKEMFTPRDSCISNVFSITKGDPFWCLVLLSYIQDFGVKDFDALCLSTSKYTDANGGHSHGMAPFIITRMKTLNYDSQILLKWASLFGLEFNQNDLAAVVPPSLIRTLNDSLDACVNNHFIIGGKDDNSNFIFIHDTIQRSIYNCITPAEAARNHIKIAEFYERKIGNSEVASELSR